MSGYAGLLRQGKSKKNYASVSEYKANRELFTQYNISTFMKAFPSRLCSSPHYSELRGIIRWRSERPQKTI
jgi:hypothetical protein